MTSEELAKSLADAGIGTGEPTITELEFDGDGGWNLEGSGNLDAVFFGDAVYVWAQCQQGRPISVSATAAAFNVDPKIIVDAVAVHPDLSLSASSEHLVRAGDGPQNESRFGNAIQVWAVAQNRDVSVYDASFAFMVPHDQVRGAIADHWWMFVTPDGTIEHDGE